MVDKVKSITRRVSIEPPLEVKVDDEINAKDQPIPKEENVPAGDVNITVIQAAIDDRFKKNEADLKDVNNLMRLGFFILLVMVATIVVMVLLDFKNSANQLQRDRYEFLNQRLERLENLGTPSGKLK